MDRKAIIVISLSVVLLFTWPALFRKLYPPQPVAEATAESANVVPGAIPTTASTNLSGPVLQAAPTNSTAFVVPKNTPEQTVVLSNSVARYVFTSYGGGIKSVDLLQYPESVIRVRKNGTAPPTTPRPASLNSMASVPAMAVLGDASWMDDGAYTLRQTARGVVAEKLLRNELVLVKEFQLQSNYLVGCTLRLENRTGKPVSVPQQELVVGTATPLGLTDDGSKVGFYWGRQQSVEHVTLAWFKNAYLGCIPGTPRSLYQEGNSNVTWTAVHNQFFAMAVIPTNTAGVGLHILARELSLPGPTSEQLAEVPNAKLTPTGYQASLIYPAVTIPAGQALERQYAIYSGPKEYNALSRLGSQFKFDLDQIMGFDQVLFGSFSGLFAKMLLLAMNGLHAVGISYGLTIVVITVIIKLIFWPLTRASTRSMKRMQLLQPQMKALQDKYKDDPAKLNKKMMEFWREHKVSPFGGCLPILLQMPVFIGFFAMIQTAIELRGASFLWAYDLTQPDTLFYIPGLNFPFNPMPLLMGVTMLWQARLQPAAPGVDPMQANMMKYMPLMFLVMLYNFSSGLTLYWTVQNLLGILQTKLTKAQDEKAGEASAARPAVAAKKKH